MTTLDGKVELQHLCFAAPGPKGNLERATEADAVVEVLVDVDGSIMARRPVVVEVKGKGKSAVATATPAGELVTCGTGTNTIIQSCKSIGVRPPESVLRRAAEEDARGQSQRSATTTSGGEETPRRSRHMKGTKRNLSIIDTWEALFIENEQRVADGKKPWTDDQLREQMAAEFPQSAGKTTLQRARMYRSCYNAGTHFYDGRDPAIERKGAKRPFSYEYDSSGERVAPGTRKKRAESGTAAAKPKGKGKGKGKAKASGRKRAAAGETVVDVMSGPAARKWAAGEGLDIDIATSGYAKQETAEAKAKEADGRAVVVKSKGKFHVATLTPQATGSLGAGPKAKSKKKTSKKKASRRSKASA